MSTGEFSSGKLVIRRKLEADERQWLEQRSAVLDRWVSPGNVEGMTIAITAMLSGFGSKSANEDEAQVIAVQYQQVCRLLPLWAVERACSRWSGSSVQPSEVGVRKLDRAFAPSTAQLHMVALALVRSVYEEKQLIRNVLNGVRPLGERPTDAADLEASKRRVSAIHENFRRGLPAAPEDKVLTKEQREEHAAKLREGNERIRLQQFTAAGVDPPDAYSTLPMLISLGWTVIEHPEGGKTLLAPVGKRGGARR